MSKFSESLEKTIARIRGATALGQKVYSWVPQDEVVPFAHVSTSPTDELDQKGTDGFNQKITIDIWSEHRGDKEVLDIMAEIYDLMHNLPFSGMTIPSIKLQCLSQLTFVEPDGITTHGIITFNHIFTD